MTSVPPIGRSELAVAALSFSAVGVGEHPWASTPALLENPAIDLIISAFAEVPDISPFMIVSWAFTGQPELDWHTPAMALVEGEWPIEVIVEVAEITAAKLCW